MVKRRKPSGWDYLAAINQYPLTRVSFLLHAQLFVAIIPPRSTTVRREMVHWFWLIAALWAGVAAGLVVAAILQTNDPRDPLQL